ncbi:MAG: GNAT family N-acetyltransferase [Lachnospiraceae bacterium]|nr:GNAT family N-acetyltransferase [Lachnospiraceae bacterium]
MDGIQTVDSFFERYESGDMGRRHIISLDIPAEDLYGQLQKAGTEEKLFTPIMAESHGKLIKILRYRKSLSEMAQERPGRLYLAFQAGGFLELQYVEITESGEKGVLPDVDYYYELLAKLKQEVRRIKTNYYKAESDLRQAIERDELEYEYIRNESISLVFCDDGFSRLYLQMGEGGRVGTEGFHVPLVCDLIVREGEETVLSAPLKATGFKQYAVYYKWICKTPEITGHISDITIKMCVDPGVLEELYTDFDRYTDLLPRDQERFIKEKRFLCAYGREGRLAGYLVYTETGKSVTEDFVFVKQEARGCGIADCLHNALYRQYAGAEIKYTAWVKEGNEASERLHLKHHYVKQPVKKITLMRGAES